MEAGGSGMGEERNDSGLVPEPALEDPAIGSGSYSARQNHSFFVMCCIRCRSFEALAHLPSREGGGVDQVREACTASGILTAWTAIITTWRWNTWSRDR